MAPAFALFTAVEAESVPHRAASRQLEAVQIPARPPLLQHPDERRRAGAVEAVARAARGRLALVVVVARGAALEKLQIHPRQVDDGLHPGVFRLLAGLDARRTETSQQAEDAWVQ